MEAPLPSNEAARLAALYATGLLDTDPEERFDRITRLAQRVFDVPIALVSLVDADRQWFKSRQGLDLTETPRAVSFCSHAILGDETMVVEDARREERFADHPLVTAEPGIRFFAGSPVLSPDGHKLGNLCIVDYRPRRLTPVQLEILADLAAIVGGEVANRSLVIADELTGLLNRRGFLLVGARVVAHAIRSSEQVGVVMADVDHLKEVNDEHGHAAGDTLLRRAGMLFRDTMRASDIAARLGGDEFAVLITQSSGSARDALARLQHALSVANGRTSGPQIALSIGVAIEEAVRDTTLEALLEAADHDLYRHKRSRSA